jgi:hypothetical protein
MKKILLFSWLIILGAACTRAGDVKLAWNQSTSPGVTQNRVYFGTQSGVYGTPITIPATEFYEVKDLPPGETFFVVTALDANGNESGYSNEVSTMVKPNSPILLRIFN